MADKTCPFCGKDVLGRAHQCGIVVDVERRTDRLRQRQAGDLLDSISKAGLTEQERENLGRDYLCSECPGRYAKFATLRLHTRLIHGHELPPDWEPQEEDFHERG